MLLEYRKRSPRQYRKAEAPLLVDTPSALSWIFSSRTYRITSLDLPALDADTAYCYFLQDTRRGHYWGHRVIVQKGCKVISADIWWTYDSDFPAETFARALLTAISE